MRYSSAFSRVHAASCTVMLLLGLNVYSYGQSDVPKLTSQQWQADVRFLGTELPKRHKNAYHRMKREDFDRAVEALYNDVPRLSEDEIIVGMMKLVAMIHDGHTNMIPRPYLRSGVYPIKLYQFSDGLYVEKAAPAYADLLGGKVVRIGGVSTDEAMKRIAPVVAADNEMGVRDTGPLMLSVPEILSGLKIVDDKQKLELIVSKDGKERSFTVRPEGKLDDVISNPAGWLDAAPASAMPLYRRHQSDPFWFEYLKDSRTVYVKQDMVGNTQGETLAAFYKRVFDLIDSEPVDKLVIDLRDNGGGNNFLNFQVIVGLIRSKLDKRGHLFVITGRKTFSAAQNFVNGLERYTEAIFVGEPTADHPNMYGDNRPFTLPNSGLTVRASTLWWQDLDPRDERPWKAPDIAAEPSFDDYRLGRDPAFQAVMDYSAGSTLAETIAKAESSETLGDFVARFRKLKDDPKNKYVNYETGINRLGYALLAKKRAADAIEVFKLNVESFPGSANVYDSLGDALEAAGRTDDAVKSFEKAVSIDPNYTSSVEALKRLKKK